jgi:hypothetical protein
MYPIIQDFTESELQDAAERVRQATGSNEIEVSVDGSFRTRGFRSAFAVAFAISTKTGMINLGFSVF